jgi:RHS repeat-associated protein
MSLQVTEKVTLLPAVAEAHHGENTVYSSRSAFDSRGWLLEDASYYSPLSEQQPPVPAGLITPENSGARGEAAYRYEKPCRLPGETGPVSEAINSTVVHVNYIYDRASRRTTRRLPGTSHEAEVYAYDGLSQVKWRKRGAEEMEGSTFIGILAPPQRQEDFTYDTLGNWQRYHVQTPNTATPPVLATVFDQNRTHNPANQITSFSNTTQPVLHDPAGNTTASAPVPGSGTIDWNTAHQYQWDAWNRLIKITRSDTGAEIARHAYDGLTRRTTLQEGGTIRHFYYNDQWRSIEERLGSTTTPERHHLFHPLNRWHLIRRDRDTDSNGSLNETLYCLHDAMDPIAITDPSGTILERYNYSAFGMRRVMEDNYDNKTSGTEFEWNWEFHGEFSDAASGLHNYGFRYYYSAFGRWVTSDPIGIAGGINCYAMTRNAAVYNLDKYGLHPPMVHPGSSGFSKMNTGIERYFYEKNLCQNTDISKQRKKLSEAFGLTGNESNEGAVKKLLLAAINNNVTTKIVNADGHTAGAYSAFWNEITITDEGDASTSMHELIHAFNDYEYERQWANNSYAQGGEYENVDEGMAYGFERILQVYSMASKIMETLRSGVDCSVIQNKLTKDWRNLFYFAAKSKKNYTTSKGDGVVSQTHYNLINDRLGARISCNKLADFFNSLPEARGCCLYFRCHNATGCQEIGIEEQLPDSLL